MSGGGNPSARAAAVSDPVHGWYGSNGVGGSCDAQRAGGYPCWYVGSGERGAAGGAGSTHSINLIHAGYGAIEEHRSFAVGRPAAAGVSLSGVQYYGGGDGGWYWDSGGTDSQTPPGYGTDFFYENGGGNGSGSLPLQHMYPPQHARTAYWPHGAAGGGGHRSVDRRAVFCLTGANNGSSSSLPLPGIPTGTYEPRQAAHQRRFDDVFPSPRIGPVGTQAPRYHYAPNGGRRPRSPLQPCAGHMDDLVTTSLSALTVADDSANILPGRGHRRRPPEFPNQGRALPDGASDRGALSPGRGLLNADPFAGMSLEDVRGRMCSIAGNLPGCQFLARMVDDGGAAAARQVFEEAAGEIVRFMGHSARHVLVETLAKFWTDEEVITRVLGVLAAAPPVQILAAARNHAGSSILQTLIGRIAGHPAHVVPFTRTLAGVRESGVLSLMEDMSGSQLILKCLDRFSADQNQFITDVVVKFPCRLCMDRHGCHVFTRCIVKAGDEQTRASLVRAVCRDGLALAEHGAGNYVVQHVIEAVPAAPWAKDGLHRAFRGRYVSLARQKASSHVVQRCLLFFSREQVDEIVGELVGCDWQCTFRDLISDPYANYVVQTAMERTEGQMHITLLNAIGRYKDALGEDRFAKQVFQKFCTPRRSSYW